MSIANFGCIRVALGLWLLGAAVLFQPAVASESKDPRVYFSLAARFPNPQLEPDQVVRIQLEALRANDAADHGISICFRFASPGNRANTGPVDRFGDMIKAGSYSLMLDYREAEFQPIEVVETQARQKVILVGDREVITYVFYLSRQTHPECPGCWMTDSVTIEQVQQST